MHGVVMVRFRNTLCAFAAATLLTLGVGCANKESEIPARALGAAPGELMPLGKPAADLSVLADQSLVKTVPNVKISYDPLPEISNEARPAAAPAAADKSEAQASSASSGGGGGLLGAGISLFKMARGGKLKNLTKIAAGGPGASAAAPAPVKLTLVAPRDAIDDLPPHSKKPAQEEITKARQMAELQATQKILMSVAAVSLGDKTVGQVVMSKPDAIKGPLAGLYMVAAKWSDETTLELTIQIKVPQLAEALAALYPDAKFDALKKLGEDKAIEVTGQGKISEQPTLPIGEIQ